MDFFRVGLAFLALSTTTFTTLSAQSSAQSGADQVSIHVNVSARGGEPVDGLTKDDFTVFDNKHQQPITDFHSLAGTTAGVVIVLDTINLPYTEVSSARQELAQFFSANQHLPQPTTLGVLQNSGLQMQSGFTTDGNALRSALDHYSIGLRELPPSTGVYGDEERLEFSVNAFKGLVARLPKQGIKRIIWISPGWSLLGGPAVELNPGQRGPVFADIVQISTELRRLNIIVDAVNPVGASQDVGQTNLYENFLRVPRKAGDVELGQLGLQVIAVQSGGLVLNGSNDLGGMVGRCIAQTKSGYELTFTATPAELTNEYHELQVKVGRAGAAVRTSAGYYANPAF